LKKTGDYLYYWFVTTAANTTNNASWYFDISLGIKTLNSDADIYVSVMDGRFPTELDFDYMSDMIGTDFIRISSSDAIFKQGISNNTWDPKVGMMVVVAVLARNDNLNFSLTVIGLKTPIYNFTDIATNVPYNYNLSANISRNVSVPSTFIYRWFNWGQ
jgi:hypothetical protein